MSPSKLALLVVVAIIGGAVIYPNYPEVRAYALKGYEFGKQQAGVAYEFALAEYDKATKPPAPPAQPAFVMPVPVVGVAKRSLPLTLDYSARVEAVSTVTLQAKASGYVLEQLAADGTDVKEGDLLYRIDPRDYDAVLELAKAQLARDTASLDYLKSNLDRGTDLAKSGYVSKDAYDQRTSAVKQAESALAIDRASIRTAELNRSYTEIRAPFSGRLGRSTVSVGTLVGGNGMALNTLVKLDPIYVTFNPSETELGKIQAARASGDIAAEVTVPGSAVEPVKGTLTFIDNGVDKATGTIEARATIPNPKGTLLPGQYVHARLMIGVEPDVLMVPQAALGSSQFGKYLYVVGEGNKVEMRPVTLGRTEGELVAIVSGLKETDQVIAGNLQKIGPGLPVQPMPQKVAAK